MKSLRLNVQNIFIQFIYFISFCAAMLYAALYLNDHGFPVEEVGSILAIGNLLAVLVQQQGAKLADRSSHFSVRDVAGIQIFLPVLVLLPLVLARPSKTYIAIAFVIILAFELGTQSILNTISLSYESRGYKILFSVIRGFGSLGYSLTALFLGAFFEKYSVTYMPYFMIASHLLASLFVFLLPQMPKNLAEEEEGQNYVEEKTSTREFYKKYPNFIPLVIGGILLFIGHTLFSNFLTYIMDSVGGTESQVGIAASLASFLEIITLFTYAFLRRRLSDSKWLGISSIFFTVKGFLLVIAQNPTMVYVAQLTQIFAYGLYLPSFTYYANRVVDTEDMAQGQAVTMVVAIIGGAIGNFLAGSIIGNFGVTMSLVICTVLSGIGTLIYLQSLKKHPLPVSDEPT